MNHQLPDRVNLWLFPASDFDGWATLVCEETVDATPAVRSYDEYLDYLEQACDVAIDAGSTPAIVRLTVDEMRTLLGENELANTSVNRAIVIGMHVGDPIS